MSTSELFLIGMVLIYVAPWLIWRVFNLDSFAPLAIIQIIAGVIMGPGILGVVLPLQHAALFNPQVMMAFNGIAWWGVMMFVFLAGVELDVAAAWDNRQETILTATLALLTPLLLGSLAAFVMLSWSPMWQGGHGSAVQTILGIGMACAVTALPILVLLLEKLELLRTAFGQRVLRYASLDDVAIWFVLALILLDWQRIGRQVVFMIGFALCSLLLRRLLNRFNATDRWYVALIWLATAGFLADWAGLHFMVGAFLAGVIIDPAIFPVATRDQFRNVVLITFMPVFFLSTGLRTTWAMGGTAVFAAALLLLLASVAGKLLGVQMAGRVLKWKKGEAHVIGWLLQTKALIMIVFVNILLDKAIISSETFTALIIMAVGSTLLTIPMVRSKLSSLVVGT